MNSPKYYRHWTESEHGEGTVYFELLDSWITRQIEVFGQKFIWCDENGCSDERAMLSDQPVDIATLKDAIEIDKSEFESLWERRPK